MGTTAPQTLPGGLYPPTRLTKGDQLALAAAISGSERAFQDAEEQRRKMLRENAINAMRSGELREQTRGLNDQKLQELHNSAVNAIRPMTPVSEGES